MGSENYHTEAEALYLDFLGFAGGKVKRAEAVRLLIDKAYRKNAEEKLAELAFTAKYVRGLMRVVQNAQGNPEVANIEEMKSDLAENTKKSSAMLNELLAGEEDEQSKLFVREYLELNTASFAAFQELLGDLDILKQFLNDRKRL